MKMPYLSYKTFMQERYGEALLLSPSTFEYGCPNRDQDGKGGCTFLPRIRCIAAQIADARSIEEQVQKDSLCQKTVQARSFCAYLQAYTNTFATLKAHNKAYEHVLPMILRPFILGQDLIVWGCDAWIICNIKSNV